MLNNVLTPSQKLQTIRDWISNSRVQPQFLVLNTAAFKEFKEDMITSVEFATVDIGDHEVPVFNNLIVLTADYVESFLLLAPVPFKTPRLL